MKDHLSKEQFTRLRELYDQASQLSGAAQENFLNETCGDDLTLKQRLTALINESLPENTAFENVWDETFWPALKSLREDPSHLDSLYAFPIEDSADSLVGKIISHFEVLSMIGRGGMAIVYKAHDQLLDRTVALKFLPPVFGQDHQTKERFIHEAKTASALDHPNIAAIYEISETEDHQMFIAMAFYEGKTLSDIIGEGPVPVDVAIDYITQLARALDNAHQNGIIHRDIKPGNVMITEDGAVKLMDFGLAKLAFKSGYTQVGELMGTVAYMSPEQARGEKVDHRTDIWSLGVVLFELLTGRRPFDGENIQHTLHAILDRDPWDEKNLTGTLAGLPKAIIPIIRTCLAKDPGDRYQSSGDLLEDLRRVQGGGIALGRHFFFKRGIKHAARAGLVLILIGALIVVAKKWIHPSLAPIDTGVTFTRMLVSPFKDDLGGFIGVFWGDYDGDANVDLLVTGPVPRLYHNDGGGVFTRVVDGGLADQLETEIESTCSAGAAWVDFDNDGDLDVYVSFFSNTEADADRFFLNNGDGTFTRVEADWIPRDQRLSVSWADADNDGLVDLFAGKIHEAGGTVFRHLEDGTMAPVEPPIGYSLGCDWSDYDLDGDVDLFYGGRLHLISRNDGNWVFTKMTPKRLPGAPERSRTNFGVSTGDFDNDGDPDLVLANQSHSQLFRNDREAGWTALDGNPITEFDGHGCAWGDYDNDGYLDLITVSGHRQLYHNEGDGTFTRVRGNPLTEEQGRSDAGAWADFDNDGDLDIVLSNGMRHGGEIAVPPLPLAVYRNDGVTHHWLILTLVGTESNRSAIGAKVYLEATLKGTFMRQFREVKSASGHLGQNDMRVHFGLADATVVDRVTVRWPSGIVDEWTNLEPNQFLTLVEGFSAK